MSERPPLFTASLCLLRRCSSTPALAVDADDSQAHSIRRDDSKKGKGVSSFTSTNAGQFASRLPSLLAGAAAGGGAEIGMKIPTAAAGDAARQEEERRRSRERRRRGKGEGVVAFSLFFV